MVRKPNWLTTNQRPENPSFLETTNFASVLVRFSRLPSRKSAPRSLSGHRVTMPFGWRWRRDADPTPAPPSGDLNRLDAPAMARVALLWNDYGAVCLAPDPVGINRSSERAATNKGLSIIWGRPLPPLLSGLWSLGQRIPYPSRFRRPVLVLFFFFALDIQPPLCYQKSFDQAWILARISAILLEAVNRCSNCLVSF